MARGEPSLSQILLDEIRTLHVKVDSLRLDISAAYKHAEEAHKRVDKYENRFWGWMIGMGGMGAAGGMTLSKVAEHLPSGISKLIT